MRGTDDLLPEQRPSGRKMRGRSQPYRKKRGRALGAPLDAMLKGGPAFLPNPQDLKRQGQKAMTSSTPPKFPEGMSDAEKRRRKNKMRPQTRGRYGRPNVRA